MLLHLHVKNLALIRETEIDFGEGLNILTGETGAGKSIIIGSITMALGGKVSKEMLRADADHALAELVFRADHPALLARLEELGIPAEDGQVILSRKISGSRSICRLNGETVSTAVLREVASFLIDIHGQHEHQSLLNKRKHMEILDEYAHEELSVPKAELSESYRKVQNLKKELEQISQDAGERIREQSLLEFELQEIADAALKPGEDELLEQTYRKMVGARKILEALSAVRMLCSEGDASASELVGRACRELMSVSHYDESLEELGSELQEIDGLLSDLDRELGNYMESMEFSEQDFRDAEERINLINHLKAKYGATIEEIGDSARKKQERLELLMNYEQHMERLHREYDSALKELTRLCGQVHEIRKEESEKLSELMKKQLAELNFLDVRFKIAVTETEHITSEGCDDVEFLISTNPGEPLKALGKIASGGELSRVMLAIKTVLADQDAIDTVIFDEIDAGISGRTAQKVSEKLALIGRSRQVICITHLAQLASMSDSHYCIEKRAADGGTVTDIRRLSADEEIEELARLLGGAVITDAVRENAREMKKLAVQFKGGRDQI